MRRILSGMAVLGLGLSLLAGCEAFKKKPVEQPEDKMAIQEVTPESDTLGKSEADQPMDDLTAAPPPTAPGGRTHVVQKGDTLFKLARQYYNGDQSQWKRIWQANQSQIPNPNVLKVGQQLVIP